MSISKYQQKSAIMDKQTNTNERIGAFHTKPSHEKAIGGRQHDNNRYTMLPAHRILKPLVRLFVKGQNYLD